MRTTFGAAVVVVAVAMGGCDKDSPKEGAAGSGTGTGTGTGETKPAPVPTVAAPVKLQVAVDDTAAFVSGERVEIAAPDFKGRLGAALGGKVGEGENIVLNAARDTKLPKVATVFAALLAKKAKGVEVHTPQRDRSAADIVFVLGAKASDCSAVGYIAKDNAITTWPQAGATAERFTHGMAGPDMTRGSEGIRKRVLTCEAPTWFVSADDSVTWGLVFDLVLAVMRPEDAGLPKPRAIALLHKPPVPGRKVDVDAD